MKRRDLNIAMALNPETFAGPQDLFQLFHAGPGGVGCQLLGRQHSSEARSHVIANMFVSGKSIYGALAVLNLSTSSSSRVTLGRYIFSSCIAPMAVLSIPINWCTEQLGAM